MYLDYTKVKDMLVYIGNKLIAKEDKLCTIDAQIGDGDHGHTMARGFKAANQALQLKKGGEIKDLFELVGKKLISQGGGASGPLFATIFLEFGAVVEGKEKIGRKEFAKMFSQAVKAVKSRGDVKEGEKTMIDALAPAARGFAKAQQTGTSLKTAVDKASRRAKAGVEKTKELTANKGRAKFIQERAQGYQDAGATSVYLIVAAIKEYLEELEI